MYAQKLSFNYAHTLNTVRIVHNAHSVHRSRVQKGQSCDCINFVRATDKAVTGLIQRIPQKGLISGIFANGRPTRSYFFALSPEMLNAVGCIIQRTEAVR